MLETHNLKQRQRRTHVVEIRRPVVVQLLSTFMSRLGLVVACRAANLAMIFQWPVLARVIVTMDRFSA